jgi:hypothetical protein
MNATRASAKARAGEVYTTQLHDGRWCACQVVRAEEREVELLALDWIGDAPPAPDALAGVGALHVEEAGALVPCRVNAGPVPPWRFALVGEQPLVATFERRCASWSGWGFVPHQVHAWWRWNHLVPEEIKATRREQHRRRGERVEIVLHGRAHSLEESTWRVWLGPEALPGVAHQLPVDPAIAVEWERLEPLATLSEVHYTGRDPAFAAFLATRPFVSRMLWRGHAQRRIDLSKTWLEGISVEVGPEPLELVLPPVARSVSLLPVAGAPRVRVVDPREGWGLSLGVRHEEVPDGIDGVPALRNLALWGLEEADATRLARFPSLQTLELRGSPGVLRNPGALAELPDLRELVLRDLFDFPAAEVPPADAWPALDTFEASGVLASDAEILRARLAGLRVLSIREARSSAWLEACRDNPLRQWAATAPASGRRAARAYQHAAAALAKLRAGDAVEARRVLESFVAVVNDLARHHRLEPLHVEAAGDAFGALVDRCPAAVDRAVALAWLDAARRF